MTNLLDQFERCSTNRPCAICGHDSWCMYRRAGDGAICARRESSRRWGDAGWYHGSGCVSGLQGRTGKLIDVDGDTVRTMHVDWREAAVDDSAIRWLANDLGVSSWALGCLDVSYERCGGMVGPAPLVNFQFPMRHGGSRQIIGVRMRSTAGQKWSQTGSKNGLFIPSTHRKKVPVLYIVEGPTDCAAGIDLGLDIIGRPDASSCDDQIAYLVAASQPRRVVIIADNDQPKVGLNGARKLRRAICRLAPTTIITPPAHIKDLREWKHLGCTIENIRE